MESKSRPDLEFTALGPAQKQLEQIARDAWLLAVGIERGKIESGLIRWAIPPRAALWIANHWPKRNLSRRAHRRAFKTLLAASRYPRFRL
jgi:hypothetical protein